MRKRLFGTWLAALLLLSTCARAGENCFLWKIQKDRATVYLLGTLHAAPQNFYPLDKAIESAFRSSDVLVLEIDLGDAATALKTSRMTMAKGTYPKGESLEDHLKPETLKRLRPVLTRLGLPYGNVKHMRPWFLSALLALQGLGRQGLHTAFGVDMHFRKQARICKMPVQALETPEEQIAILSGASAEVQELGLIDAIDQMDRLKVFADTLLKNWKTGNSQGLFKFLNDFQSDDPRLQAQSRRLLDDRNRTMVERIKPFFKTDKTYFVAVGAAHLVGPVGIPMLLRKEEYPVEQVQATGQTMEALKEPEPVAVGTDDEEFEDF